MVIVLFFHCASLVIVIGIRNQLTALVFSMQRGDYWNKVNMNDDTFLKKNPRNGRYFDRSAPKELLWRRNLIAKLGSKISRLRSK